MQIPQLERPSFRVHGGRAMRVIPSPAPTPALSRARARRHSPRPKPLSAGSADFSALAHELRNAMAPLSSALDIVGSPKAEPQVAQRMVDLAQRQLRQMSRLVDDLLDAGRMLRSEPELQLLDTTVQEFVDEAVRACSRSAVLRRHTLSIVSPAAALPVRVDPVRMHQVLLNLVGNAIKYTPAGGRIDIRIRGDGARATIAISDNGIGFAPDRTESLFQMFQRDPRARALSGQGLGIGLAVARRLVELHGGTLTARSDGLDQGSTFVVALPLGRRVDDGTRSGQE